ncbi:MAG TPA: aminotransferase class V-fold PLP-dependent enzyme [Lacipirellulaceae bacterium]|nr:aminotransferase class V-fold PLP-dependent enzyme [Lacipirellulaceae bacterium]
MTRIYLDNAATSWPKPPAVIDAVQRYMRDVGAPYGRAGYAEATQAGRIVGQARQGVAELLGAREPEHVVFTSSGSDALNLAIRGVLRPGDHVVTSVCEHNSILRPLRWLSETAGVTVDYVPCDGAGHVSPDDVRAVLRPETRLAAFLHVSNVTGAVQPVAEIGAVVREHGALYLVDAAQSLGHMPVDVLQWGADLVAAPGHKGLLGPLGTGVLWIRPGVEQHLEPLRFGGTGTQSDDERQPDSLPDKFEAGNHNLPGIAGLAAATQWLQQQTPGQVAAHHLMLTARLLSGLRDIPGLTPYGPPAPSARGSVVSLTLQGYDPQELAALLDASHGVQCRAGLHCAPRMHEALGTKAGGGALRLSVGCFTTAEEVDTAIAALQEAAAIGG